MTLPEPLAPPENVATVKTSRSVSLSALEQALGLSKDTLSELNPELRSGGTPGRDYDLRVPAEHVAAAPAKIAQLPEWTPPRPAYITHRVRSGQTLGRIARQYGTTVGRDPAPQRPAQHPSAARGPAAQDPRRGATSIASSEIPTTARCRFPDACWRMPHAAAPPAASASGSRDVCRSPRCGRRGR